MCAGGELYAIMNIVAGVGFELTYLAYETKLEPLQVIPRYFLNPIFLISTSFSWQSYNSTVR